MLLLKSDLYKIAKARLKNDEDIYDVIQETMIEAFNSIKKLRQIDCFKSWIIKILINKSNNLYKKKSKNRVIPFEEIENYNYSNNDLNSIEETLDFEFICKNLNYNDRIIMILYYTEKYTDKEIGKILNLKENTVKTKRVRAKQKIKNILKLGGKYDGWIW